MKKIITLLVLVSTLTFGEALKFYAGGGLAYESLPDYSDTSSGIALVARGGVNLNNVLENFGAEVELSKSLLDPKVGNTSFNVMTLATYGVYTINITSDFYVKPRFGVILPNLGSSKFVNSRDIGFVSGIGGGYHFKENLDIYFNYTVLGEGLTNWGSGVEYHF